MMQDLTETSGSLSVTTAVIPTATSRRLTGTASASTPTKPGNSIVTVPTTFSVMTETGAATAATAASGTTVSDTASPATVASATAASATTAPTTT